MHIIVDVSLRNCTKCHIGFVCRDVETNFWQKIMLHYYNCYIIIF